LPDSWLNWKSGSFSSLNDVYMSRDKFRIIVVHEYNFADEFVELFRASSLIHALLKNLALCMKEKIAFSPKNNFALYTSAFILIYILSRCIVVAVIILYPSTAFFAYLQRMTLMDGCDLYLERINVCFCIVFASSKIIA